MTRWEAFTSICDQLAVGLLKHEPKPHLSKVDWKRLINVSSRHFVTPALGWCFKDKANLPPEIRAYFDAALVLNARRNDQLLKALKRVTAVLNLIDIEPILLKGAARLVDNSYPSTSVRILGDLDILIPAERAEAVATLLKDVGFDTNPNDPIGPSHHHLPMLVDRKSGAGVEIHKQLTLPPFDTIIPTRWFWENSQSYEWNGLKIRLPNATQSAAHNVVHDQLLHGEFQRNGVELRQLIDLALIRAQHDNEIDWDEIDRRFCSLGMGHVLATYLEFAAVLLGQAAPKLSHPPKVRAITALKRSMGTWQALRRMTNVYIASRQRDPIGVLRLFKPSSWPNRIRLIRNV
jgi:hypothetical protein